MFNEWIYEDAKSKAAHFKALGERDVWCVEAGYPYSKVTDVQDGGSVRLGIPVLYRLSFVEDGLRFTLRVEIEPKDANGSGTLSIDRRLIRELFSKLPVEARAQFVSILREKALPEATKRREEIYAAMSRQSDAVDCISGLVAMMEKTHG